jgi:hypothetical protein
MIDLATTYVTLELHTVARQRTGCWKCCSLGSEARNCFSSHASVAENLNLRHFESCATYHPLLMQLLQLLAMPRYAIMCSVFCVPR